MDVVLTHANADFDAVAAMLAAARLYPGALPILPRTINRNVREFLSFYGAELPFVPAHRLSRSPVDQVILVDTHTFSNPRGMHDGSRLLILDHHQPDRPLPPNAVYEGEATGATTTFLVHRMRERRLSLSPVEASLLLLGIYEDTGNLSYTATTARDAMAAGWLLEHGASLQVVDAFTHRPLTAAQRRVYEDLERTAETHEVQGQSVVMATAAAAEPVEELSSIVHKLNDLFDPDACFAAIQLNGNVQLIARSRSDSIDVARVLSAFGGGGHARAAAALVHDRQVADLAPEVLRAVITLVKPAVTARQIMAEGVHTLSPDMPLAEAAQLMQRWGHEGFPVAANGRYLGMLTRRETDRALQHRLGAAPVRSYMRTGDLAVGPGDAVVKVRQLMLEHDLGQIPVVESQRLVGIVTRTDVMRLMSAPAEHVHPAMAERLRVALAPSLLDLLLLASDRATAMGYSLYLVGGFVRDLLLGAPNLDLDLVVEGDAVKLVRTLAAESGGHLRVHERFGTARWQPPDVVSSGESTAHRQANGKIEGPGQWPALDFVTARREFYEQAEALPSVEASSLRQDLYRRDFTINTMALRLERRRLGELVDYYGGQRDLERRLIRVLHNFSFVEDATRMIRAVRLEQRLGFTVESRTQELITEALDLLGRVSGERLRHELFLVLGEAEPARTLSRLEEMRILDRLIPSTLDTQILSERFTRAREEWPLWCRGCLQPVQKGMPVIQSIYLALLAYDLSPVDQEKFMGRLRVVTGNARLLREVALVRRRISELMASVGKRSRIHALLDGISPVALFVVRVAEPSRVREAVDLYYYELKDIKPLVDGQQLRDMGVPAGPAYARILAALLAARLDGAASSLEDEQRLAMGLAADLTAG